MNERGASAACTTPALAKVNAAAAGGFGGTTVAISSSGATRRSTVGSAKSVGEIFTTKNCQLRLVTSNSETTWIKGIVKSSLTPVPVEDNIKLIYGDLGVYPAGLGTPCDDL